MIYIQKNDRYVFKQKQGHPTFFLVIFHFPDGIVRIQIFTQRRNLTTSNRLSTGKEIFFEIVLLKKF